MFEIGKHYDFEMLDDTDSEGRPCITTYPRREVLAVDGPLVKIAAGKDGHLIINTHSSVFVRATPKDGPSSTPRFAPRAAPGV